MNNYCVLELDLIDDYDVDRNEALDILETSLQTDGYDYYIASDPYANQIIVLVIPAKYMNGTYSGLYELIKDAGFSYVAK